MDADPLVSTSKMAEAARLGSVREYFDLLFVGGMVNREW
jgi:hypothetical protein